MVKQALSQEAWGFPQRPNGSVACVKAYDGPLPAGVSGIEFFTDIPPTDRRPCVMWYPPPNGLASAHSNGNCCAIPIKIVKVTYASGTVNANIQWP